MTLRDQYVDAVERENEMLRERIAVLESMVGMTVEAPLVLDLTTHETRMLGLLMRRDIVSKDHAMTVLYAQAASDKDVPEEKIIDVWICKMRRKLKPHGITIGTKWGQGWWMSPESKAIVRAMMPARLEPVQEAAE